VHREHLVEGALRHDALVGTPQLGPDDAGQRPADEEEPERGRHVRDADALVVRGGEEREQAGRGPVVRRRVLA
jgi:hypothetical protein